MGLGTQTCFKLAQFDTDVSAFYNCSDLICPKEMSGEPSTRTQEANTIPSPTVQKEK